MGGQDQKVRFPSSKTVGSEIRWPEPVALQLVVECLAWQPQSGLDGRDVACGLFKGLSQQGGFIGLDPFSQAGPRSRGL